MTPFVVTTLVPTDVETVCTIDQCKQFLRIRNNYEDAVLTTLRAAAVDVIERSIGRPLGTAQARVFYRGQPCGELDVPLPPLQEVTGVAYQDVEDGGWWAVDLADVKVDLLGHGVYGTISMVSWPRAQGLRVDFTCGYAATPPGLRQAVIALVAWWFETRETSGGLPEHILAALAPFRTGQVW